LLKIEKLIACFFVFCEILFSLLVINVKRLEDELY